VRQHPQHRKSYRPRRFTLINLCNTQRFMTSGKRLTYGKQLRALLGYGLTLSTWLWLAAPPLQAQSPPDLPAFQQQTGQDVWPQQVQLGPLLVHSNLERDVRSLLPSDIEHLPQEVSTTLSLPPPQRPVFVYIFDSKATYQRYLHSYFEAVPNRQALFIQSRGWAMVFTYQQRELQTDLRHECTHALLHDVLPVVPLWLDEGLAEYFEVPANQRYSGHPHAAAVRWSARLGTLKSLEELEQLDDVSVMSAADYRSAWAWVHFCLHGPQAARAEFKAYLEALRHGELYPSLSQRLQDRLPNLRAALVNHFRNL
jgi:hypothetical protein